MYCAGVVYPGASGILSMAVAADGRHAVTGAWDGQARLRDLRQRRELYALGSHPPLIHGAALAARKKGHSTFQKC